MLNQFGLNNMKDSAEFAMILEQLKTQIPVGAHYYHYKNPNQFYTVVSHGIIEATEEPAIIYQAEYDMKIIWIRPASVFLQEVEWEGKKVPRFACSN